MNARVLLVAMASSLSLSLMVTGGALAQSPPPLPPPENKPAPPPDPKPGNKGDVIIEYVPGGEPPAPGQAASGQAASGQPATPAAPPPPEKEDEGKRQRMAFRAEGGFQYAQVYGIPITGVRARLGVGAQNDSWANYVTLNVLVGSTDSGLRTWDFRVGYTGDLYRVSILRLGLDVDMGYMVFHRTTLNDRMFALGATAGAHAGVDIVAFGPRNDHAVTAQLRFDVGYHFGGAPIWGPAILIGFRY